MLVSSYELGHQPLALASPLAFLRQQGFAPTCLDLSVDSLNEAAASALSRARLVAISVPMHTALRLGVQVAGRVRALNPGAHICFYGLYAPLNARYLLSSAADSVRGGEYEVALVELAQALDQGRTPPAAATELRRLPFIVPQRDSLPPLRRYAHLVSQGQERLAGLRGSHPGLPAPVSTLPDPGGVRRDVSSRSRSRWCWPTPASRSRLERATSPSAIPTSSMAPDTPWPWRERFIRSTPQVTFDATIKVEHILQHRELFPQLARLGCLFVVSAVESLSDDVLAILDKGHRQQDAVLALQIVRAAGISLRPTFVPFTPWTTREGYLQLCRFIDECDLEDEVDPIQLALRLLIPPGSLLLDREELRPFLGELDEAALTYRWRHPDPRHGPAAGAGVGPGRAGQPPERGSGADLPEHPRDGGRRIRGQPALRAFRRSRTTPAAAVWSRPACQSRGSAVPSPAGVSETRSAPPPDLPLQIGLPATGRRPLFRRHVMLRDLEERFTQALSLDLAPVAVTFCAQVPDDVPRFVGTVPAGCRFWKLAAAGPPGKSAFYTLPSDHHNCPVGSYTHRIDLAPDRAHELTDVLRLFDQIGYVKPEEVPQIPRWSTAPAAIRYSRLGDAVAGSRRGGVRAPSGRGHVAQRSGQGPRRRLGGRAPVRPTCMAIPAAASKGATMSFGCVGNRVYTDLPDSHIYMMVRGSDLRRPGRGVDHRPGGQRSSSALFTSTRKQSLTDERA